MDYPDWIGLPPQSHTILQRRSAVGVPNIAMTRPRTQVILPISDPQEGTTLRVGSQVSIDESGHVGNRGTPIGIVMSLDNERHEAVVDVLGSGVVPHRCKYPAWYPIVRVGSMSNKMSSRDCTWVLRWPGWTT